ncbi:MAG: hypothetical protein JNM56_27900, partial [Planctomycetia bacterium]|nr:hypothetical protein [Planctomycetia bacterium]
FRAMEQLSVIKKAPFPPFVVLDKQDCTPGFQDRLNGQDYRIGRIAERPIYLSCHDGPPSMLVVNPWANLNYPGALVRQGFDQTAC